MSPPVTVAVRWPYSLVNAPDHDPPDRSLRLAGPDQRHRDEPGQTLHCLFGERPPDPAGVGFALLDVELARHAGHVQQAQYSTRRMMQMHVPALPAQRLVGSNQLGQTG